MRKYRFHLQKVLDYRQSVEDALAAELAAIAADHQRALARLADIGRSREEFRRRMRQRLAAGDPDEIREAHEYLQQLDRQVIAQQKAVRRLALEQEEKIEQVIAASKDRKVLERLRDYKQSEHRREALRSEQKSLDEMTSLRHKKRTRPVAGGAG